MVDPAAILPETKENRCPACHCGTIKPANRLHAINHQAINVTKEEFRCAGCGVAFWVVRLDGQR